MKRPAGQATISVEVEPIRPLAGHTEMPAEALAPGRGGGQKELSRA